MTTPVHAYRPRLVDDFLAENLLDFPAIMITGARATGKTTTAAQHAAQVDRLDQPGVAASYRADPDAALARADRPVLLDEWQEVPEVLAAVKRHVDADPTPGQILITGSVRAPLLHEMWAGTGRVVHLTMHGLTVRELANEPGLQRPLFLTRLGRSGLDELTVPKQPPVIDDYVQLAIRGGFPEVAIRARSVPAESLWLTSYLDELVTRDAALVDAPKDPDRLRRYLQVLALNNAGLPTAKTLLQTASINARTATRYDQLLTNLFVLNQVPAWSTNRLSRLVKAPKRYIVDPGLAATAAGVTEADVLTDADLMGRYVDAFSTAQLRPELALMHPRPRLHHLRMEGGRHEVDLIVELGAGRMIGLEFKAGVAVDRRDARHLIWLRDQLGEDFVAGAVLHTGPAMYELERRIYAVPLCAIWS